MGSGNVAPLMCLVLVSVLHFSNGQLCGVNQQYVYCYNACGTCEQRGFCPDCRFKGCDCLPGFVRDETEKCVLITQCRVMKTMADDSEAGESSDEGEPLVQESGGCPHSRRRCAMNCNRRGFWYGVCVGRGRRTCRCRNNNYFG